MIGELRTRHDNRSTLDVKDEYDVQDLLRGLLQLFFDDVRPEEYTPSYAGKSTRMDFLLKDEATVIEVKMTRNGLGAKELGEQLILDIAHYKSHPNCRELYCLVYDPEARIKKSAWNRKKICPRGVMDYRFTYLLCRECMSRSPKRRIRATALTRPTIICRSKGNR
ncbi:hypothetical protein [Candidatus Competibacter phosphatis]|uniref:PD-(D/E)XK nuclease domain-containing protein n=1 Tax=Candidatus Competibacter phosphatis TaxID=221280 RepID=UPI001FED014D|nr:hypothetical protein [Candidatus Competibacter phosphatis]